ncbi:MAG TPA: hypothetical protein VIM73_04445 [Polyangiaceae bacterium]
MTPSWPRSVVAAALLSTGCPLTTFEVEEGPPSGGTGGSAGASSGSGGATFAGLGGGVAAGAAGAESAPELLKDEYAMLQGETLSVLPSSGVLANDSPDLQVVAFSSEAPPDFQGELDIGPEGGFEFRPASDFFGIYRIRYTAENQAGQREDGDVEIRVVPTGIRLESVAHGIGGFVLDGFAGDALGVSLDGAGDLDGDGKDELIVGAPGAAEGAGAAYVVRGTAETHPIRLEPLPLRSSERRFAYLYGQNGDSAGVSVAGIGDIDQNGSADLVIGANGGAGRAYVVFGHGLTGGRALSPELGFEVIAGAEETDVGRVVSAVGDVTGDGVPDVLVSSRRQNHGWIHVVSGPDLVPDENDPRTSTLGALASRSTGAAAAGDAFPLAAASALDIDGDGYGEVFTASHSSFALLLGGTDEYPESVGELGPDGSLGGWSLVRGGPPAPAAVARAGDVDGDGTPDVAYCDGVLYCKIVFGPPATLASGWNVAGFATGTTKLLSAGGGDTDDDGFADLLFADDDTAYVVYGKPTGHSELNLAALRRTSGYALRAPEVGTITAVAMIGDLNGDGIGDFAIGDASFDAGAGRVYVLFGVSSDLDVGPD